MTNWEDMTPGERDALVATRVLGMTYAPRFDGDRIGGYWSRGSNPWYGMAAGTEALPRDWSAARPIPADRLPSYSRDMDAAWQVMEHLAQEYLVVLVRLPQAGWQVTFTWEDAQGRHEVAHARQSAPEAICCAALDLMDARGVPAMGSSAPLNARMQQKVV